jgi:tetratricopeptide (TPR) repeat protein
LATALTDGTTHSTGHAVEVLQMLAAIDRRDGDHDLALRRLRTAAKLAVRPAWQRYARHVRSLVDALGRIDPEGAAALAAATTAKPMSRRRAPADQLSLARALLRSDPAAASASLRTIDPSSLSTPERAAKLELELYLLNAAGEFVEADATVADAGIARNEMTPTICRLHGIALEALGRTAEAIEVYADGAARHGDASNLCAIGCLTLAISSGELDVIDRRAIDPASYSFPTSARLARMTAIGGLACGWSRETVEPYARQGCWSTEAKDMRLMRALPAEHAAWYSALEDDAATGMASWLLGDESHAPAIAIDRTDFEVIRSREFADLGRWFLRNWKLPDAWDQYLLEHVNRIVRMGSRLWDRNEFSRARRYYLTAMEVLSEPELADMPGPIGRRAEVAYSLASLQRSIGAFHESLQWAELSLSDVERLMTRNTEHWVDLRARTLSVIGNCYFDLGQYDVSISYHRKALDEVLAPEVPLEQMAFQVAAHSELPFRVVLHLFNYANSIAEVEPDKEIHARFAAAAAFSKVDPINENLEAPWRREVIDSLGEQFRPLPDDDEGFVAGVIRHLHANTPRRPS